MNALTPRQSPARRHPLANVLIGGLALHGHLDIRTVVDRAEALGLGMEAQERAMFDLIDRGLASVSRTGSEGQLIATPAITALAQAYRERCIVAYTAVSKASDAESAHG